MEKNMSDMASAVLTELRLEGTLCDVVIKVGDIEFDAHNVVLCTCSPYFPTLFTGAWATSKKKVYTIPGVSPEMIHLIINYAYSHSVPVTEDNVVEVLAAADQFMVTGIVQTCCLFLENQLCLGNCISIWRLVDFYHCPELRQKVFLYILRHFKEIVSVSEEFEELSVQQLAAVIEDDHLNVKQENTVFDAVIHWINYLPDQRRGHISALLHKVYICGGYNGLRSLSSAEYYNPGTRQWTMMPAMRYCRSGLGVTAYRNCIYAVGGTIEGNFCLRRVEVHNPQTNRWIQVPGTLIPRSYFDIDVVNDQLYVVGGYNGVITVQTVERYDDDDEMWYSVACIDESRSGLSCCVLNGLDSVAETLFPSGRLTFSIVEEETAAGSI